MYIISCYASKIILYNISTFLPDGIACEDFPLSGHEGSGPIPESSIGGRSRSGFGPYGPLPSTPCNGIQQIKHEHAEFKKFSIMRRKIMYRSNANIRNTSI
jgi:hypothetical protein